MSRQASTMPPLTAAAIPVPYRPIPSGPARQSARGVPAKKVWHQFSKHPVLMPYFRWFALTVLINLGLLYYGLTETTWWLDAHSAMAPLSYLALGNFAVAIFFRQHYVINALFWLATRVPVSWPLSVRWAMGKVYHFGGWHSGCATMGTLWFIAYTYSLTLNWRNGDGSQATLIVSMILMGLLLSMIVMALPAIRGRYHNHFELIHRLGGWSSLLLFWLQTILVTRDMHSTESLGPVLLSGPSFWLLGLITFSIILPWLRLRKVAVDISRPSSHVAVARFDYGVKPFAGSSTALSCNPLREWHSFANIPAPNESGFRLTISRAGDWTGRFIDNMPSHVWVKAIPTAGVGNVDQLFKRVLWVATGSGIGPCLPHLLAKTASSHLVWSTRHPEATYGEALLGEIIASQLDAIVWDTDAKGKPDMLKLVRHAYARFQPEAVICISNKKLTYQVVYDMESRGIPAFGAIWDS